jgi:hypothetical protein
VWREGGVIYGLGVLRWWCGLVRILGRLASELEGGRA